MEKKMTSIGGQAIIEGVMMKGPSKIAMAVRKPDGEIIIEEKESKGIGKWAKVPIIRGVIAFVSSMVTGVQALMFSAKFFDIEDDEDTKSNNKKKTANLNDNDEDTSPKECKIDKNNSDKWHITEEDNKESEEHLAEKSENLKENTRNKHSKKADKKSNKDSNQAENGLSDAALYGTVFVSLIISIGLFMLLPNFIADIVVPEGQTTLYNVVEHLIKIVIFLGYLIGVSKMKDIQRVFEYHGAEHKSIFCYENGEELTVENVKKHSRFHPRCGTSFLLFVIIVSIIFFSFLPRITGYVRIVNILLNMGIRLLLMPIVAGISYEIIKFAGKSKNKYVQLLNKPGMWLQRLTTREPDDSQIEVAIASLKAVIPENGEDDRW